MNNTSTSKYDSEFCGSLPIHVINHVQPYGVLLVVDSTDLTIIQCSENVHQLFGTPVDAVIKSRLDAHLSADSINVLKDKNNLAQMDKMPAVWTIAGRSYLAFIHWRESHMLIEVDLTEYDDKKEKSFVSVYQEIKYAMGLIQSARSIEEVAQTTARELKRISGFDKVMIYRFDKDWNGTVMAEQRETDMESYLGFTFPASDVPQPARQLYLRNPYRFIPSREYEGVKLYPVINPITHSFLDLSDCNLRGVANVHIEYLRNMNVMASMSTRILVNNSLWGLIACHHRKEKHMSFEVRSVFEMISNIVSAKISSLQSAEVHHLDRNLKEGYRNLIEEAYRNQDLHVSLLQGTPDILSVFNAQGAAISAKGRLYTKGNTPTDEQLKELLLWLHTRALKGIFYTSSLGDYYDGGAGMNDSASGMLAIPIDFEADEYVMIFRPEVIRVINWGGNPNERIQFDKDQKNYHPRNSFRLWQEKVKGTSLPWREEELVIAESLRSFIYEFSN
jgi:two-component system, chemotaxis family, sensor kinase Cph1